MGTIFTKIIQREIPSEFVHEDDICVAIRDVSPQAPVHVLIIPKKEIPSLAHLTNEDQSTLGHLMMVASKVAQKLKVDKSGYRLVINTGDDGGQTVLHLHVHLLAGRALDWPPG